MSSEWCHSWAVLAVVCAIHVHDVTQGVVAMELLRRRQQQHVATA
jgi:hypothetical protein